ncbi:MAG: class I SAM-dependent methyltransferase [Myxococcota bacterium]
MSAGWEHDYRAGTLPWDTGVVDPHLEAAVREGSVQPCRALEIGCGTGTNALWLADAGFAVTAIDIAPTAIEMARAKGDGARFEVCDFLRQPVTGGPFDFVFDRGVFHVFDHASERALFAQRVADLLGPEGLWLSLIGSTEGPPRDFGPPRRSARQIAEAVEPHLEIVSLQAIGFHDVAAWACLSRRRPVQA